jgi:hypothetical protein
LIELNQLNIYLYPIKRSIPMSWFKHKPRTKTPPKLYPHYSSPIAEKILKETKLEVTGVKAKLSEQEKKKK